MLTNDHEVCLVTLRKGGDPIVGAVNMLHKYGSQVNIWRHSEPVPSSDVATIKVLDNKAKQWVNSVGKYNFYRNIQLGSGGQGGVYLGRHSETRTFVAVKELEGKGRECEHEALAAFVNHENVIKLLTHSGKIFVLELLETNLTQIPITTFQHVFDFTLQILRGLKAIHEKGLAHRDMKPANIMYKEGVLKISDFGAATNDLTGINTVISTPKYEPPELGPRMDHQKGDVFSTGVIIADMIADCKQDTIPFTLDRLCTLMTQRDPEARPNVGSAIEILQQQRLWKVDDIIHVYLRHTARCPGEPLELTGKKRTVDCDMSVCTDMVEGDYRGRYWFTRNGSNAPAVLLECSVEGPNNAFTASSVVGTMKLGERVSWDAKNTETFEKHFMPAPQRLVEQHKENSTTYPRRDKREVEPNVVSAATFVAFITEPVSITEGKEYKLYPWGAVVLLYGSLKASTTYDCCYPFKEPQFLSKGQFSPFDQLVSTAHSQHMLRVPMDLHVYNPLWSELEKREWKVPHHKAAALLDHVERGGTMSNDGLFEGTEAGLWDTIEKEEGMTELLSDEKTAQFLLPHLVLSGLRKATKKRTPGAESTPDAMQYMKSVEHIAKGKKQGIAAPDKLDYLSWNTLYTKVTSLCEYLQAPIMNEMRGEMMMPTGLPVHENDIEVETICDGWKTVTVRKTGQKMDFRMAEGDVQSRVKKHVMMSHFIAYMQTVLAWHGLDIGFVPNLAVPVITSGFYLFVPVLVEQKVQSCDHLPNAVHALAGLAVLDLLGFGEWGNFLHVTSDHRLIFRPAISENSVELKYKLLKTVNSLESLHRVKALAFLAVKILSTYNMFKSYVKAASGSSLALPPHDAGIKTQISTFINRSVQEASERPAAAHSPTNVKKSGGWLSLWN